jgi:dihydrofolate reductase
MGDYGKTITLIAAMANNRGIGLNGKMPWHLPGELQHFKKATMGKAMVMGRKTWESIGKALPGRQSIVVSRNPDFQAQGCDTCTSLQQAVEIARSSDVMVIGGGELYRLALPLANRMILTLVDCECPADTWFPDWSRCDWILVSQRSVKADEDNPYSYQVRELVRS